MRDLRFMFGACSSAERHGLFLKPETEGLVGFRVLDQVHPGTVSCCRYSFRFILVLNLFDLGLCGCLQEGHHVML